MEKFGWLNLIGNAFVFFFALTNRNKYTEEAELIGINSGEMGVLFLTHKTERYAMFGKIEESSLTEFLNNCLEHKVPHFILSEKVPTYGKELVKKVVHHNFESVTKSHDIVICFVSNPDQFDPAVTLLTELSKRNTDDTYIIFGIFH